MEEIYGSATPAHLTIPVYPVRTRARCVGCQNKAKHPNLMKSLRRLKFNHNRNIVNLNPPMQRAAHLTPQLEKYGFVQSVP